MVEPEPFGHDAAGDAEPEQVETGDESEEQLGAALSLHLHSRYRGRDRAGLLRHLRVAERRERRGDPPYPVLRADRPCADQRLQVRAPRGRAERLAVAEGAVEGAIDLHRGVPDVG